MVALAISPKLQKPRGYPLGAPPQASRFSELSELLLDEAPSRDIHEGPASYSLISQLLTLAANAIALCQGAHLGSLKLYNKKFLRLCFTKYEASSNLRGPTVMEAQAAGAHLGSLKLYNKKFLRLCFTKYEASSNLRGPTVMEAQAADKRCWELISDLVNQHSWKLDDALHELSEDTRFDEQRNVVEEVTGVPLCVSAQPSGSPGATLELSTAQSSVSPAALAICQGNLDFTTWLELLVNNFSIPFVASFQNDPAIKDSEAYFNLGAFAFDNGSRFGIYHRAEQFSDILRFLNAFMQLQFPEGTWSSLCVSHNVRTRLHTDAGNKPALERFHATSIPGRHMELTLCQPQCSHPTAH
eukprot:s8083_g2.t1